MLNNAHPTLQSAFYFELKDLKNCWSRYLVKSFFLLYVVKFLEFNCLCVKRETLCNCSSSSSCDSASLIRSIGEFEAKTYFTDHRIANTIHLFVRIKSKFFVPILFRTSRSEGEFSEGCLVNRATSLFAFH